MKNSQQQSLIPRFNDFMATRITIFVCTMWAFYAFVIFGLTPLVWPSYESQILYWSNFLQLIFLPVITVGTAIMSRSTEARAAADHEAIKQEFAVLQEVHDQLGRSLKEIGLTVQELHQRSRRD